jgi:hypothetical protein
MGGVALLIIMSPVSTVPAHVEGFASLGVVVTALAPVASVLHKAGVVSPRVIKVVTAVLDFIHSHDFSWGIIEYNLRGEPVIGVCLCKCNYAIMSPLLQLEEVIAYFCDTIHLAMDFGVKSVVADDFRLQGVILFQVDHMIDKLRMVLVGEEGELLFVSQHGM